jgi:catechol 2,3-dioxygenase-like lactoylglutathione lyase family enzyme
MISGIRENGHVAVQRMDNVGIVVDDLPAAIAFFRELYVLATNALVHPRVACGRRSHEGIS